MRRRLVTALIAIPLFVVAFYVAERFFGRQNTIAICEKEKGTFIDRGLFGKSVCSVNR